MVASIVSFQSFSANCKNDDHPVCT